MGDDRRLVQLQVNNSGAWKTVARFAADSDARMVFARRAVAYMALVDARARWRIATCDALPVVLQRLDAVGGWSSVPRPAADDGRGAK